MTSRHTSPGTLQGTWLVAEREVRMRMRSKSFLISTGILLLLVLAGVMLPSLFADNSLPKVAAVGSAVSVAESTGALEVTEAASVDEAEELVRSEEVAAALVPDPGSPTEVAVIALEEVPGSVLNLLSVAPTIELLEPSDANPALAYLVAFAFGLIFFVSAITFGSMIAQSVVEEKQTRIIEILMATLPVRVLLAGKIVGNSILAFGQILLVAIVTGVGMLASGQDLLLADVGPSIVWFVVFFLFGFVLLAAMFAATGAMVSRQEDLGATTTPVTMLIMVPYFAIIFFYDNPLVLTIMSYVPFSAPVGMPMRVFLGETLWWEPVLSLIVLIVSTIIVIGIGSRIYSNSLLRTGARVTLKEALTGA
ncbi:ABC transporter permease [Diaminobutyricimonas sp. LJ205]|uniref:ABC transporter permease n=1 Tax=Diaminobutyricimonas sp. LJ205 TaxID=2683590 RepID=UPI001E304970|nr:ABC transporter permease [Diaminobutyricimonas sp. LJ205]